MNTSGKCNLLVIPSEIVGMITSFIDARDLSRLFFCGCSLFNQKLCSPSCATVYHLSLPFKKHLTAIPSLVFQLRGLQTIHIELSPRDATMPSLDVNSLLMLPNTLTDISLRFLEAELCWKSSFSPPNLNSSSKSSQTCSQPFNFAHHFPFLLRFALNSIDHNRKQEFDLLPEIREYRREILSFLPPTLTCLEWPIVNCDSLLLPSNLDETSIGSIVTKPPLNDFERITKFPLRTLKLVSLKEFSDNMFYDIPSTLTHLDIRSCSRLDGSGFEYMPRGLLYLNLHSCTGIDVAYLDKLPQNLTYLDIGTWDGLHTSDLALLPRDVTFLDISLVLGTDPAPVDLLPPLIESLGISLSLLSTFIDFRTQLPLHLKKLKHLAIHSSNINVLALIPKLPSSLTSFKVNPIISIGGRFCDYNASPPNLIRMQLWNEPALFRLVEHPSYQSFLAHTNGWVTFESLAKQAEWDALKILVRLCFSEPETIDLENLNRDLDSSIHYAVSHGNLEMLKWLLKHTNRESPITPRLILSASFGGHVHMLQWLKSQGLPLDYTSIFSQELAAHVVASKGHLAAFNYFVENSITWRSSNKMGLNCAHIAAINGHLNIIERWKELGMPMDSLDSKSKRNLAHYAAEAGFVKILEWLERMNVCSLTLKDNFGRTPEMIALAAGKVECAKWFEKLKQPKIKAKK
jgi:hypothetical protein